MHKLSIIIPCYNEEEALPHIYNALYAVAEDMSFQEFEYIFVNDGSKDKTAEILIELAKCDERVKYISFSRNFGKEAAMHAGLKSSSGDFVAIIDADMQDPPKLIKVMYDSIINDGYDCVAARRTDRKGEPPIRSFFAKNFYKIINKISDANIVEGARDFRLMTRQMVDAILSISEYNRFSKGIFGWVGFDTKWITFENTERVAGNTKWSFWGLLLYAMDGIVAFSTKPLAIASFSGIVLFFVSIVMVAVIVVRALLFGDEVAGWPSTVSIICFIGGIQLLCIGILGQYLAKTYLETKNRPTYIVKKTNLKDR